MFRLEPANIIDGEDILPLDVVKQHLEVESEHRDLLIASFRDAAIDMVQQYTNKQLLLSKDNNVYIYRGSQFPRAKKGVLRLGVGPIASIVSIEYINYSGVAETMNINDVAHNGGQELQPVFDKEWPVSSGEVNSVIIMFHAGYAIGKLPKALTAAMLLMVGHLYANREAVVVGTITSSLPLGFEALCDKYREPVI